MHLVQGGVPGLVGGVPGPRRGYLVWRGLCTWSQGGVYLVWGGYLVLGGVPGLGDVPGLVGGSWSQEGVPGLEGVCTWSWGVYLVQGGVPDLVGGTWSQGGAPGLGGCVPGPRGVYLVRGGVYLVRYFPPPVNRITHTCKNITLPQLRCGR